MKKMPDTIEFGPWSTNTSLSKNFYQYRPILSLSYEVWWLKRHNEESFASEPLLPFPFPKASLLPSKRKIYSNLESFLRVNLHYHLTLPELTVNQALIDLVTRVREVSAFFISMIITYYHPMAGCLRSIFMNIAFSLCKHIVFWRIFLFQVNGLPLYTATEISIFKWTFWNHGCEKAIKA